MTANTTAQTTSAKSTEAPSTTATSDLGVVIGRIPVTKVSPVLEGGAYAAKATEGERLPIRATVFREGHDAVAATVVLTSPSGAERRVEMVPCEPKGWNRYEAYVRLDEVGPWTFRVEGWDDPWKTWVHHAEVKLPAGMDVELVCLEAAELIREAAEAAREAGDAYALRRLGELKPLLDGSGDSSSRPQAASLGERSGSGDSSSRPQAASLGERSGSGDSSSRPQAASLAERSGALAEQLLHRDVRQIMAQHGPRRLVSPTPDYPIFCDRRRALFGSWYEFFPRSQGAAYDPETGTWTSGTFDSSHERIEAAAAMGFDVIYLPPIHPIGTSFRKGPNNTLTPGPNDPGSPWAIGNVEGGHDAIHPELGDWDAFDRFVAKTRGLGMEVALDFALQASPDHPWVTEHPEWFSQRPDGTIAYAENPPKKYQDIYPVNFDRDREGIYAECLRLVEFWIAKGVKIFRVDNPHTKPVEFWAWLLGQVRKNHPDVLFLAEAFTKPEMMHMLGKVGFHQSYTYFTWRNEKWEIEEYLGELTREMDSFYRPNFFVNTPDINPAYLQTSGPAGFAIRAVLAATLSPTWGVYSGYELFEAEPLRVGGEEYLNSEKFQLRPRDWSGGERGTLTELITILNRVRREVPALQQLRDLHFHHVPNSQLVAYSKSDIDPTTGTSSTVIVVCSLDPHHTQESEVYLDLDALGLEQGSVIEVHDHITGADFRWGARNYVRLSPAHPAHVLTVVAD